MDYLNYGKKIQKQPTQKNFGTVQKQQPKKPQPQDIRGKKPQPQDIRENFKFGNLIQENLKSPQPVSSPPPPPSQTNKDTFNKVIIAQAVRDILFQNLCPKGVDFLVTLLNEFFCFFNFFLKGLRIRLFSA